MCRAQELAVLFLDIVGLLINGNLFDVHLGHVTLTLNRKEGEREGEGEGEGEGVGETRLMGEIVTPCLTSLVCV